MAGLQVCPFGPPTLPSQPPATGATGVHLGLTGSLGSTALSTSAAAMWSYGIERWSPKSSRHWSWSRMFVTSGPLRNADVYGVTTVSWRVYTTV